MTTLTPERCEQAAQSLKHNSGNIFRHEAAHALRCHSELLAALEAVQFVGPRLKCPACGGQPSTGHVVNAAGHPCRTGLAIYKAKGEES